MGNKRFQSPRRVQPERLESSRARPRMPQLTAILVEETRLRSASRESDCFMFVTSHGCSRAVPSSANFSAERPTSRTRLPLETNRFAKLLPMVPVAPRMAVGGMFVATPASLNVQRPIARSRKGVEHVMA